MKKEQLKEMLKKEVKTQMALGMRKVRKIRVCGSGSEDHDAGDEHHLGHQPKLEIAHSGVEVVMDNGKEAAGVKDGAATRGDLGQKRGMEDHQFSGEWG